MADKFKLDDKGNCPTCGNLSNQSEHLLCFTCKHLFHGVCSKASNEEKVATQTLIKNFVQRSTKSNFKFFCDNCATALEVGIADTNGQRMNLMENKMNAINKQLEEIKSIVKSGDKAGKNTTESVKATVPKTSIWNDPERLANVKAPISAALVIPTNQNKQLESENKTLVEKTLLENSIPLKDSFTNQAGELVLLCESAEKRDELKNLVENVKQDIDLTTLKAKRSSITIVGLMREYTDDEVTQLLLKNDLIRKFASSNDIAEHFQVHSIKPLKNKQYCFQAFATVSQVLREGISKLNDKLVMGIKSCKVYDRKLVKRCFNCQKFGHFAAECPTPQTPMCGKCSGEHSTRNCTNQTVGCINCKRDNLEYKSHSASYHGCPALLKYEELNKKSRDALNLRRPAANNRR